MTENAIAIITPTNVSQYFVAQGLNPVIEKIRQEVKSFAPDISTEKGRKEIASMARRVASSKVALDDLGKDLVSGLKAQTGAVDAERKRMRDELDRLRDEVRKPLTDWELRDEARIAGHKGELDRIEGLLAFESESSTAIQARLESLSTSEGREWDEFCELAKAARERVRTVLLQRLDHAKKQEADRAELERLQQADRERQQRERDERIQAEATARARAEAEAAIAASEERAKRADAERRAAEEKARSDALAAEAKAKRDAEIAVQQERERAEAEKKAEAEATAKREADKKHRAKINNEILSALVELGLSDALAKIVVEAAAKSQIPFVKVGY